ncbi:MAG: RNA polymerase sigma factor [Acutalibacteraceae bacterium]
MKDERATFIERLYAEYGKKIYGYFCRRFDKDTADDLCQQTFLRAWQYLLSYGTSAIKSKKSWLFTIAKNTANDYLRYKKSHPLFFAESGNFREESVYQPDFEASIAITKALEGLSKEERELLSLSEHLTSREIGSVLGISASAVRTRLQKARNRLSDLLERQGIEINRQEKIWNSKK